MKLLLIVSMLGTASVAQEKILKQDEPIQIEPIQIEPIQIEQGVDQGEDPHEKYTVPMSYEAWGKLSPEMQKAYAEVSVDALKWSYLFNDCDPLTGKEMAKAIQNSDKNSPIMMAIAAKAYEICQN